MLEETLKQEIKQAMISKDSLRKNILRLVLGEIQTKYVASNLSEEDKLNIVRKIIKSNNFTMEQQKENNFQEDDSLKAENEILTALLPVPLTYQQTKDFIVKSSYISKGDNPGKCMGLVMQTIRKANLVADSKLVKQVVDELVG